MLTFTTDKLLIQSARLRNRMQEYRQRKATQIVAMKSLASLVSANRNHFRHSFLNVMG